MRPSERKILESLIHPKSYEFAQHLRGAIVAVNGRLMHNWGDFSDAFTVDAGRLVIQMEHQPKMQDELPEKRRRSGLSGRTPYRNPALIRPI
jgi:hypothetical protein